MANKDQSFHKLWPEMMVNWFRQSVTSGRSREPCGRALAGSGSQLHQEGVENLVEQCWLVQAVSYIRKE